jgi:hypothetical protein
LLGKPEVLQRVDKEEEFRRGLFQSHLKQEDSCGSHSRFNLQSMHYRPNFESHARTAALAAACRRKT